MSPNPIPLAAPGGILGEVALLLIDAASGDVVRAFAVYEANAQYLTGALPVSFDAFGYAYRQARSARAPQGPSLESAQETLLRALAENAAFRKTTVAVKLAGNSFTYNEGSENEFCVDEFDEFTVLVDPHFEVPEGEDIVSIYTDHLHRLDGTSRNAANLNIVVGFSGGSVAPLALAVCSSTSSAVMSAVLYEVKQWVTLNGTRFEPVVHVHDCKPSEHDALRRVFPSCTRQHYCSWHLVSAIKKKFERTFRTDCGKHHSKWSAARVNGELRQAWAAWRDQITLTSADARAIVLEAFIKKCVRQTGRRLLRAHPAQAASHLPIFLPPGPSFTGTPRPSFRSSLLCSHRASTTTWGQRAPRRLQTCGSHSPRRTTSSRPTTRPSGARRLSTANGAPCSTLPMCASSSRLSSTSVALGLARARPRHVRATPSSRTTVLQLLPLTRSPRRAPSQLLHALRSLDLRASRPESHPPRERAPTR
jgi:hypothetical protein